MPTRSHFINGLVQFFTDEEGNEFFGQKGGNGKGEKYREYEEYEHDGSFLFEVNGILFSF
jgi:hypothetical protein